MKLSKLILLRISQSWLLIRVLFARFSAMFTAKVNFWLISERGKEARDNGYALYRWIKSNHPEISLKYVITKESKDYHRIEQDDVVEYNSFTHLIYVWKAKYLISTHIMGFMPDHSFFARFDAIFHFLKGKKIIFLQHGITMNRQETLFYNNVNVDLFVSGSQIEYDYLTGTFGYPEGIIKYTGLCRYDNLLHFESKKQILIMPTFRMYIDMKFFEESDYFKAYSAFLESDKFHDLLEKYDYSAVFYPHYAFQSEIASFHKLNTSSRVVIADMTYDVQQLLKDSEVLVTDYSSVFFDMMYMNKPVVFYQFDYERFTSEHYKSGYLDHNHVGPVVEALPDLLYTIEDLLQNKGDITSYQSYYDRTFTKRDTLNCKRVYDAIIQC